MLSGCSAVRPKQIVAAFRADRHQPATRRCRASDARGPRNPAAQPRLLLHPAVLEVAAEQFVAAVAAERDRRLPANQLRDRDRWAPSRSRRSVRRTAGRVPAADRPSPVRPQARRARCRSAGRRRARTRASSNAPWPGNEIVERLDRAEATPARRHGRHQARVDAAAEHDADRHIGDRDGAARSPRAVARALRATPRPFRVSGACGGSDQYAHRPQTCRPDVEHERVPLRKLLDAAKQARLARHVAERQVAVERVGVQLAGTRGIGEQRLQFRGERRASGRRGGKTAASRRPDRARGATARRWAS